MVETKKGFFHPKNPKKYSGNINSIIYRSSWELMFMQRLDESEDIVVWGSEEVRIPYVSPLDNDWHTYYPDFLVRQQGKNGLENLVIEIKPIHEILRPVRKAKQSTKAWNNAVKKWAVNQTKWRAAAGWCEKNGAKFIIATREKNEWGMEKFRLLTESEVIWK